MTNLKSRIASIVVLGAVSGLAFVAGCSSNPPAQPPQDQSQQPDGYSEHREIAPLKAWIEPLGQGPNGDTGLRVMIEAREPLSYPVQFSLQLPPGVQLVSGNASEVLQLTTAGRTMREIHVQGPALTELAAVHVILDGHNAGTGIHSDVQFPKRAEMMVGPRNGPNPPGGRPPMAAPRLASPHPRIRGFGPRPGRLVSESGSAQAGPDLFCIDVR